VILRAAAALPHGDRQIATRQLRHQLHVMAVAANATPDWATLTVTGPAEMAESDPEARFEWTATVAVREATTAENSSGTVAGPVTCPSPVRAADGESAHLHQLPEAPPGGRLRAVIGSGVPTRHDDAGRAG
jgi:hypothetical protein